MSNKVEVSKINAKANKQIAKPYAKRLGDAMYALAEMKEKLREHNNNLIACIRVMAAVLRVHEKDTTNYKSKQKETVT